MKVSLPMRLAICVAGGVFFGNYLSSSVIAWFLTASTLIKDVLMWVLPLIVWTYLSSAILSFREKALWMMIAIVGLMVASNALALSTVYGVSTLVLPWISGVQKVSITASQAIEPLWHIPWDPLLKPEWAIAAAVFTGVAGCTPFGKVFPTLLDKAKHVSHLFISRCFVPVLPIYVLGFVLKLQYEGSLSMLLHQCMWIFALGWGVLAVYLFSMYWVAAGFSMRQAFQWIGNMLPAGLTGFSTMSSMATLPLTIEATEENLGEDSDLADLVIPTTVNSHLTGDNINIGLTALSLLWMMQHSLPSFYDYMIFIGAYCLVKFSATGVPGGGVIVILPVLRDYLHLDVETTSLLATLYIIQDGLLTGANVMGNGALALLSRRLLKPMLRKQQASSTVQPSVVGL